MNYHKYIDVDVVNGPGTRCTLFVSGCAHHCRGCYNASTWCPDSGHGFNRALEERIIADLKDARIRRRGLSISGGDPLYPANCPEILKLTKRIKAECPRKDIWVWTGYTVDQLNSIQREILKYIDVLVDGPFVQSLADPSLRFRGSSNQRILNASEYGGWF